MLNYTGTDPEINQGGGWLIGSDWVFHTDIVSITVAAKLKI